MAAQEHPTYGNGKICYIELPSRNLDQSIEFYKTVFGWNTRKRNDGSVGFDDSVNEVSGTWRTDRKPFVELGILIHIMVSDIHVTVEKIIKSGGIIVLPIGQEPPQITARFSDPTGNVLGLYQH